jgi:hypothetical protein
MERQSIKVSECGMEKKEEVTDSEAKTGDRVQIVGGRI